MLSLLHLKQFQLLPVKTIDNIYSVDNTLKIKLINVIQVIELLPAMKLFINRYNTDISKLSIVMIVVYALSKFIYTECKS